MKIKQFEFNIFGENTFIVWDKDTLQAAIIDPGMSSDQENMIIDNFIADNKLNIKAILLTHLHIDHTLGVDHIVNTYNVPIMGHKNDAQLGLIRNEQARMFRLPYSPGPITIDNPIDEGTILTLGKESIYAIPVPGHSPGSMAFHFPESGFVITGDTLFLGSIGRTDLPGGDYSQLIKNIQQKLLTLPRTTIVHPGHGPSTTIDNELRNNPFIS